MPTPRRFQTIVNHKGYQYTRCHDSKKRVTYRCSVYRRFSCRARVTITKDDDAQGGTTLRASNVTVIGSHRCRQPTGGQPGSVSSPTRSETPDEAMLTQESDDDDDDEGERDVDTSYDYEPDEDSEPGDATGDSGDDRPMAARVDNVSRPTVCAKAPVPAAVAVTSTADSGSDDDSDAVIEVIDAKPLMEAETDKLSVIYLEKSPTEIWDLINEEFYVGHTNEFSSGLTKQQVISRVYRARNAHFGNDNPFQKLEQPPLAFVLSSRQPFFQFHHSIWADNTLHRAIGWANPALLSLLRNPRSALFIDGTFRSVPKGFYQCLVVMVYDYATDYYVPVFHVLVTGKSELVYKRALACVKIVADGLNPATVSCDFELALHNAVRSHFDTTIIGCFFHWKQAIRRWLLQQKMPQEEVAVALLPGYLDVLTVVERSKIVTRGIRYVQQRVAATCRRQRVGYSTPIWDRFWVYFNATWMGRFDVHTWNVHGVDEGVVNRTNNPLERYNKTLNGLFVGPHPSLATFVTAIERDARRVHRTLMDIQVGRARAPAHAPPYVPRYVNLQ